MAFVRVRLENGSEASISAEYADLLGLKPLNKPAAVGGRALPAKHNPLTTPKPVAPAAAESSEEK